MSFTIRRLREERPQRALPWKPLLVLAGRLGAPVVAWWFRHREERHEAQEKQKKRSRMLRRIFIALVCVLVAVLLLAGFAKALIATKILNLRNVVSVTGAELPIDEHGHTNILLLGQGDESHDGVDLTDTIMIASLDPSETHSAVLLSLPRDLYMTNTNKMGTGRINALYRDYKYYLINRQGMEKSAASQEAMKELAAEIGSMLDMEIHHVVKVDFIGFVQAVDALGGVEVEVPQDIVDTEYPGSNYSYQTFSISAGVQLLDGETALKYARSRHTTSDFDRSARQQQIIKELAKKVRDGGLLSQPGKILSLLNIVQAHMESTMSVRELLGLGKLGTDIDHGNILAMQLNTSSAMYGASPEPGGFLYNPPRDQFGGASVLLPIPYGTDQFGQIRTLVKLLVHLREPYLARPVIHVLNAGAVSGSSRSLGNELVHYGFLVERMENVEDGAKVDTSYVETVREDDEAGMFIADMLGLPLRVNPATVESSEGTVMSPLRIVLGKDYTFTTVAKLLAPQDTVSE